MVMGCRGWLELGRAKSAVVVLSLMMAAGESAGQGVEGRPTKPPARPEEPAAEREVRAKRLRDVYSRSPAEWPAPEVDPGVAWVELGPLPGPVSPPDNPSSKPKVALGKQLFFDPRISGSGQIACASCHDPDLGWADGRTTSFGHSREALRRNAPGLLNVGSAPALFWDGRASSLEAQAREVMLNPKEMNATTDSIVSGLAAVPEYRAGFKEAFGSDEITVDAVAKALATFERSLVGGRSRFDRFLKGSKVALSDEAILGLDLFRGKARCLNCHNGPTFSDGKFHDLGLSYYGRSLEDLGRYKITAQAEDVGRFRTPSLRNVAATAPYMHNGLFALEGVLNMYNAGMATLRRRPGQEDDPLFPTKSPLLKPLGLNRRDLADLRAFLESLTEPKLRVLPPPQPGLAAKPLP